MRGHRRRPAEPVREVLYGRDVVLGGNWTAGRRFGTVAYEGPPLPAPDLPITRLMPRGRTR